METIYRGPDRRIRERREIKDRREMIRFELDKQPRRSGKADVWNDRDKF